MPTDYFPSPPRLHCPSDESQKDVNELVATVLTAKPSIYEEKPSVLDFEVAGSN